MNFQSPPVNTVVRMARPKQDGMFDEYSVTIDVVPEDVKKALDEANWKLATVRDREGRMLMLYGSSIIGLDQTDNPPDDLPVPIPPVA
jgi:hypothetical protein